MDFTEWIGKFTKSINSLFNFDLNDLQNMILTFHYILFLIHINRFNRNRVIRFVVGDGVVISNDISVSMFYGHRLTNLLLEFHSKLESFDLNENEMALLYVFFLTSCNGNLNKNKSN